VGAPKHRPETSWIGSYVTVYDDEGRPSELYFTGFSGD
jgi:hypothetical protein